MNTTTIEYHQALWYSVYCHVLGMSSIRNGQVIYSRGGGGLWETTKMLLAWPVSVGNNMTGLKKGLNTHISVV